MSYDIYVRLLWCFVVDKQSEKNIFNKSNFFEGSVFSGNMNLQTNPVSQQTKSINDFDSSLILENIDKKTKNKAVRINLKINTLEKNLARITEELELLELLNLDKDKEKKEQLSRFKSYLELQINKFKSERKKFGVWYSISGFLDEKINFHNIYTAIKSYTNTFQVNLTNARKRINKFSSENTHFKW